MLSHFTRLSCFIYVFKSSFKMGKIFVYIKKCQNFCPIPYIFIRDIQMEYRLNLFKNLQNYFRN